MTGTLVQKREICDSTWEFAFKLSEKINFTPGSYTFLTLPRLDLPDSKGPRRHISLVDYSSEDQKIKIAVRIRNSGFKQTLLNLNIGDEIDITKPYNDISLPADSEIPVVMIAGGMGITPYMSMLSHAHKTKLATPITLLYSNKRESSTAYLEEIRDYESSLINFVPILLMTSDENWTGEKTRINKDIIQKYIYHIKSAVYYFVGPEKMNQDIEQLLDELEIPEEQIFREDFTGY